MKAALSNQNYLALNRGRYSRKIIQLPRIESNIYLTTHLEIAATDLLHYHETAHLSFILNGGAIDKRKNSETERSSSELMFFRAGELHETIYRGFPVRNINIELEADFFRKNAVSESDLDFSITRDLNSKFTLLKVYNEILANDKFSDSSIEMLLIGLVTDNRFAEKNRPDWLNKVVELLHDNWNEEISLGSLASAVNVHPKTISKYFPKFFNCTLGEYRRRIKIERSLSMIKSAKTSLTDIAYECGFYDQSHFTSSFKQITGLSPKRFQNI